MIRFILIVVVVYVVYQLATNWSGPASRDIRGAAHDAEQSVENSSVGREVKKSVKSLEDYIP